MARRGENIYKRKDGRYEGRYVIGRTAQGRTKFGYVYGRQYHTVRSILLEKKAAQQRAAAETGGSRMRLEVWMEHWLEWEQCTLVLWITVKWRPKFIFSLERLKGLVSYGWKLLASALLDTVDTNLRQLVIGRMYTTSDLAFYNQGVKFPEIIATNINTSIDSVLLPTMSQEQDDRARVKGMTRRAITVSTYIMAPLMMGLACCADTVVLLILTEKWLPS